MQRVRRSAKSNKNYMGVCVCMLIILLFLLGVTLWNLRYMWQKDGEYGTYQNCYITECESDAITILAGDQTKVYKTRNLQEDISNTFADIVVENGYITKVYAKEDKIRGKVTAVDDTSITIENYGTISLTEDFVVYKNFGTLGKAEKQQILVGYDVTWFYLEQDRICGAVILEDANADTIRVLISNSDYTGYDHNAVTITCSESYIVTKGKEKQTCKKKEELKITADMIDEAGGEVAIVSSSETKPIRITTLTRGYGTPSYYGKLYITKGESGLRIINELPLEKYLYYVVPSEMPASYGLEALKVQAVCARTFGYRAILDNAYGSYGAHVDDSISCQVYNNAKPTKEVKQAVNETYGQVLTYENAPIIAYFFSTSCGVSTDNRGWGVETEPYIKGKTIGEKQLDIDLSDEKNFARFIKGTGEAYDAGFPYYRWQITYTGEELAALVLNAAGQEIGTVTQVKVEQRGTNGIIERITFIGTDGRVSIEKEYTIRKALSMNGKTLLLQDCSKKESGGTLPSAFFTVEKTDGNFTFYGGGYGHGMGMSQNATSAMTEQGMKYEEILKFFYHNIELTTLY